MNNLKRAIKKGISIRRVDISFHSVSTVIFAISLGVFLLVQLIANAQTAPLGMKLQAYNNEKNALLNENRSIEQDLATIKSLTAIEHLTQKSLKLTTAKESQIVYIVDSGIRASR